MLWGVLDLLGDIAAKSSYSKVLVGERSGRLPCPPWEKGMSDGLIPNSFTLNSSNDHSRAQRSEGQDRRGKSRGKEQESELEPNIHKLVAVFKWPNSIQPTAKVYCRQPT